MSALFGLLLFGALMLLFGYGLGKGAPRPPSEAETQLEHLREIAQKAWHSRTGKDVRHWKDELY
ncbi:hypothetical protein, partial [Cupriavidus campinensis]|uniref:hypothetical protein n=1 Tax=Cupriavidus campinensis TaxID=151783 RepID=UPI003619B328